VITIAAFMRRKVERLVHVGLNLVFLAPGEQGGLEVYARELIAALAAERPDLRLTTFGSRLLGDGPWCDAGGVVEIDVDPRNSVEWVRGEQQVLPPAARRAGVDVLHSFASTAPARGDFKRVTTIHDVIYKRFPEAHPGLRTYGMRMLVPLAARRSHRVIAISSSTRDDLVELLRVDAAKIDVVPNGAGHDPVAPVPEAELRARHGLGDRQVVLSVSAKRPVKNLKRLIDALALIPGERRPVLVIPGYPTDYEDELKEHARAAGVDADVRWLGWTSDEELEGLYGLCVAFAFPSLYEGFGLPVLEAMMRGVPVACSDRSSLPEVAGDAALLFDPEDAGSIASVLERLLGDADLRASLALKGRSQAARFSWATAARLTAESYERALGR
jgi:glycosyltransferase involved in cell wall biosynthesis